MLPVVFGPISKFYQAVLVFNPQTGGLNAIYGLFGVGNMVLCLFDTRSDKLVESRSFGFD